MIAAGRQEDQENLVQHKLKLMLTEWAMENEAESEFAIWPTLYQILSFFFLSPSDTKSTALGELKQRVYGWYSGVSFDFKGRVCGCLVICTHCNIANYCIYG